MDSSLFCARATPVSYEHDSPKLTDVDDVHLVTFGRLRSKLTDEAIDAGLALFKFDTNYSTRVWIVSSRVVQKMMSNGEAAVDRWCSSLTLSETEIILFPCCLDDHWLVVMVDVIGREMTTYCSLGYDKPLDCHDYIDAFMHRRFGWTRVTGLRWGDMPLQQNGVDCGVFMLLLIECITHGRPLTFGPADIDRRRIAARICCARDVTNTTTTPTIK
jgi:Ulp1 family protease